MLPSNFRFETKEKKEYPPLPEDVYQVELLDIDMQEVADMNNPGETRIVLKFQFVILDEGEYRGRSIWQNFVPTYIYKGDNSKNALYQITKAIIMRDLTEEERLNFGTDYINKLVGYQCRVGTVNKPGKGKNADKVYTNIDKFLPKKMSLPRLTEEEKEKAVVKDKKDVITDINQLTSKQNQEVQQAAETLGGQVVEPEIPTIEY
jgi:hypothetical protein